ncbi:hypothetical protein E4U54_007955 [Claviceps lovelessii]|nr:hypothetical protein E4U54_007955 [Claviceps lovelessii]
MVDWEFPKVVSRNVQGRWQQLIRASHCRQDSHWSLDSHHRMRSAWNLAYESTAGHGSKDHRDLRRLRDYILYILPVRQWLICQRALMLYEPTWSRHSTRSSIVREGLLKKSCFSSGRCGDTTEGSYHALVDPKSMRM